MAKPLQGVKVLDLTKVLAGPLCAQYLGEMGADIVKVEPVGTGDETRGWPPFRAPGLGGSRSPRQLELGPRLVGRLRGRIGPQRDIVRPDPRPQPGGRRQHQYQRAYGGGL